MHAACVRPANTDSARTAELLRHKVPEGDPVRRHIEDLNRASERINEIVKRMGEARHYATQPYVRGVEIVDFERAAEETPE